MKSETKFWTVVFVVYILCLAGCVYGAYLMTLNWRW